MKEKFRKIASQVAMLLLLAMMLSNSGCSLLITSQGKDLEAILSSTATRQSIQREIGAPINSVTYTNPIALGDIPEIKALSLYQQPTDLDALTAGYDDYLYKGIVYDPNAGEASAMIDGETFGLGELFAFPLSLQYIAAEKKRNIFTGYGIHQEVTVLAIFADR
ncbi:MAG TPA: hypothetical protein VGN23_08050 [Verrucomicrobiae bacterium]